MATQKHLVLEDDVYQCLIARRNMTGVPMGKIGNSIIRSHIAQTEFEHLLGECLVAAGRATPDQYHAAVESTHRLLRKRFSPGALTLEREPDGTLLCGSWAIKEVFAPSGFGYQVLEAWARDPWERAIEQHSHNADEYAIALGGKTLIIMNEVPCTLRRDSVLQIPAGAVHSAIPLDIESRLLLVVIPPVAEFSASCTGT